VALITEFCKLYNPDLVIGAGDLVDNYMISKFPKFSSRFANFKAELDATKEMAVLPFSRLKAKKHIYLQGNHEHRWANFAVSRMPEAWTAVPALEELLDLEKFGVKYVAGAKSPMYKLTEKFTVWHGLYFSSAMNAGGTVAQRSWRAIGPGCAFHAHQEGEFRMRRGDDTDELFLVGGCMCANEYRDFDNWARGFICCDYNERSGQYRASLVRISGKDFTQLFHQGTSMRAYLPKGSDTWRVSRDL
jgi:hypothetical protein